MDYTVDMYHLHDAAPLFYKCPATGAKTLSAVMLSYSEFTIQEGKNGCYPKPLHSLKDQRVSELVAFDLKWM